MPTNVLNSSAQLSGKTLLLAEGTVAMTGLLDLGSIGQIQFPAVQNPSAGANVLDDYEENTFSPTLVSSGGGSPTYSVQAGSYVKAGQLVHVAGRITLTNKGTLAAGTLDIGGLPFAQAGANNFGGPAVSYFQNLATAVSWLGCYTNPSLMNLTLAYIPAAGATGVSVLTVADIGATFDILFGGSYRANA